MAVVPLSKKEYDVKTRTSSGESDGVNWAQIAAGGSLLAAGLFLLTGQRRAGIVAAAAGATLVALDQQDVIAQWWNALPGYVESAQNLLNQVQDSVEELAYQRERLHKVIHR
jgi:hypothetical protein